MTSQGYFDRWNKTHAAQYRLVQELSRRAASGVKNSNPPTSDGIRSILVNGIPLKVESDKSVNITIPTKVSQVSEDNFHKTVWWDKENQQIGVAYCVPRNQLWTWTSASDNCPQEFLDMANAPWSPRPIYINGKSHKGWGHANFYDENGELKYECIILEGSPTAKELKFSFWVCPEKKTLFKALARRESAEDTTIVMQDNINLVTEKLVSPYIEKINELNKTIKDLEERVKKLES